MLNAPSILMVEENIANVVTCRSEREEEEEEEWWLVVQFNNVTVFRNVK